VGKQLVSSLRMIFTSVTMLTQHLLEICLSYSPIIGPSLLWRMSMVSLAFLVLISLLMGQAQALISLRDYFSLDKSKEKYSLFISLSQRIMLYSGWEATIPSISKRAQR
jgi:hypothetical protein